MPTAKIDPSHELPSPLDRAEIDTHETDGIVVKNSSSFKKFLIFIITLVIVTPLAFATGNYLLSTNAKPIQKRIIVQPSISPSETPPLSCTPRPACLDHVPPCMMPPPDNMCPPSPTPETQHTFCTQDAQQCPDGSYVSRHGPKCEFDECQVSSF